VALEAQNRIPSVRAPQWGASGATSGMWAHQEKECLATPGEKNRHLILGTLRQAIQQAATEVASHPHKGFHRPSFARMLSMLDEWLRGIPIPSSPSAGTGNPFSLGELHASRQSGGGHRMRRRYRTAWSREEGLPLTAG